VDSLSLHGSVTRAPAIRCDSNTAEIISTVVPGIVHAAQGLFILLDCGDQIAHTVTSPSPVCPSRPLARLADARRGNGHPCPGFLHRLKWAARQHLRQRSTSMRERVPAFVRSLQAAKPRRLCGLHDGRTRNTVLRIDVDPLAQMLRAAHFSGEGTRHGCPFPRGRRQAEPVAATGKQVMAHVTGVRDLIAAIQEDKQPLCSVYDARTTVEMISAVFESHGWPERASRCMKTRGNPLEML